MLPGEIGGDQAIDPEFDPGTVLRTEVESPGDDDAPVDETEPVEGDVLTDPIALEERRADAVAPTGRSEAQNEGVDIDPEPPEVPAAAPNAPSPAPGAPAGSAPATHLVEPGAAVVEDGRSAAYALVVEVVESPATRDASAPPQRIASESPAVQATTATAGEPRPAGRDAPRSAAGRHVVQPGDTLWSIARDLLGREASTAAIAREVHRLWELNADNIGTGDPSLILPGQVLALR